MDSSKTYWQAINHFHLLGKNSLTRLSLTHENREVTDNTEQAYLFADFFHEKVENLKFAGNVDNFILPNLWEANSWDDESINFTVADINEGIDSLKMKKSQGHDQIPGLLLKDLKEVISLPLCRLFNCIMKSGNFPDAWKISRITPLHKKRECTTGNKFQTNIKYLKSK